MRLDCISGNQGLNKLTRHIPDFNLGVTGTAEQLHTNDVLKCSVNVGLKMRSIGLSTKFF